MELSLLHIHPLGIHSLIIQSYMDTHCVLALGTHQHCKNYK